MYQTAPETVAKNIDALAVNVLGRSITEEDKQADWYKNLNKNINDMISKGIVTTSTVVKNPKTGKKETLVTLSGPTNCTSCCQVKNKRI